MLPLQILVSPNFPSSYPGGLECLHTITAQSGRVITLEVEATNGLTGLPVHTMARKGMAAWKAELDALPAPGNVSRPGNALVTGRSSDCGCPAMRTRVPTAWSPF